MSDCCKRATILLLLRTKVKLLSAWSEIAQVLLLIIAPIVKSIIDLVNSYIYACCLVLDCGWLSIVLVTIC